MSGVIIRKPLRGREDSTKKFILMTVRLKKDLMDLIDFKRKEYKKQKEEISDNLLTVWQQLEELVRHGDFFVNEYPRTLLYSCPPSEAYNTASHISYYKDIRDDLFYQMPDRFLEYIDALNFALFTIEAVIKVNKIIPGDISINNLNKYREHIKKLLSHQENLPFIMVDGVGDVCRNKIMQNVKLQK